MKFVTDLQQVLHSPFSRRIFFRLAGSILSLSLLFFVVSMSLEYRNLNDKMMEDGGQLADIYAHAIHLGIFTEDRELLYNPTDALLNHVSVLAACAVTKNGRLLMESDKRSDGHEKICYLVTPKEISIRQKVLATGISQSTRSKDYIRLWSPVYARSLPYSSEELWLDEASQKQARQLIGAVGIVMDRSSIRKNLQHLFLRYLLLNLLFLLLALFITIRIAKDASTPLRDLLQRFGARAETGQDGHPDEIASLSGTFDRIIDELNGAFSTINELKGNLEIKVAQRTAELTGRQEELLRSNALLEKALADLKSTQSQLVQSEKMAALGNLVAGMAHEINNTINFVSGALPPLKRTTDKLRTVCNGSDQAGNDCRAQVQPLFDDLDQLVDNISEGASRTAKIVKDLRDFSRPDTGQPKPADIHHNLDATLALIRPEYKHRIQIVKNFDPNLGLVPCYASQLNQVFTNLLLNSIQSIEAEGTITISTSRDAKAVHIRFADTGCGIPAAIINHVFDPFFTTKEIGKGTGLGLSISYSIVKNHGGEIRVKSEVNKGTEFEIVLPGE